MGLISAVLIAIQLAIPLAHSLHERLEAFSDARRDAQGAARKSAHHDPSHCNICQTIAAMRSQTLCDPASAGLPVLQQTHTQAAIVILAADSERPFSLANPRGPPAAAILL